MLVDLDISKLVDLRIEVFVAICLLFTTTVLYSFHLMAIE